MDKPIAFRGEGQRNTTILWLGGTDGISFTATTLTQGWQFTLSVKSLTILRHVVNDEAAAIRGVWPAPPAFIGQYGYVTANITDVSIGDTPASGGGWWYGVHMTNATCFKMNNFVIHGPTEDFPADPAKGAGIWLAGQSTPSYISSGDIEYIRSGIEYHDDCEGAHVDNVEIVGVKWGIWSQTTSTKPGTSISNNHVNSSKIGIYLVGRNDTAITGNLIYKSGNGNWVGIDISGGNANRIIGNHITDYNPPAPSNGIVLEGAATNNIVQGNVTTSMDTGIWLVTNPSTTGNLVMGNISRNGRVAGVLDWGVGNTVVNNY